MSQCDGCKNLEMCKRNAAERSISFAERAAFCSSWARLAAAVHENAVTKGFWEAEPNQGEKIALMHSELSEALEGIRHGNPPSDHIPEFSAIEEELADVIIRAMDFATKYKLRLAEAMLAKHAFNVQRPHKHGKAF